MSPAMSENVDVSSKGDRRIGLRTQTEETGGWFEAALTAAESGWAVGGVPIGAALVSAGNLLAVGHNRRAQDGDPTAHAEIVCLRTAGRGIDYRKSVLFSTLAPCAMCAGAILQFGIPRLLVGESVNFTGELDLLRSRGVQVEVLDDPRAIALMETFIREKPELWNEDIGVFD
ncbi:nucleoside deaminase [Arthrobacter rhombi]|uniref:nucleoside deaminase n=1 Tax=Arthrobacter rhombi TaxID=71253 RepID=UPI003FD3F4E3